MEEGLFHLSVKMVQRSKGRSATGAIAYRAGADITDERTGLRFNYKRKTGVSRSEIILPTGVSERFKDRSTLWNAVEQRETRKNSAVAREFEIALPYDLPRAIREKIGIDFCQYLVDRFAVAADINFHDPHPRDLFEGDKEQRNYHGHILTSTRVLGPEGFTNKVRALDSATTGSEIVAEVRAKLAALVNDAYASYGAWKFVDHRSLVARKIDRVPQIHVGPSQDGDRAALNAAIIAANGRLAALEREREATEQEIIQVQIDELLVENISMLDTAPQSEPQQPMITCVSERVPDMPVETGKSDEEKSTNVVFLEKVRRYMELQQLQKKAGIYGRAIENLREQNGLAASFQRELDRLDRPGLLHRFWNSKRWRAYEEKQADLRARIDKAQDAARRLQAVAKEYKSFQTEWDKVGYVAHKALSRELSVASHTPITTSFDTARSIAPSRGRDSHSYSIR